MKQKVDIVFFGCVCLLAIAVTSCEFVLGIRNNTLEIVNDYSELAEMKFTFINKSGNTGVSRDITVDGESLKVGDTKSFTIRSGDSKSLKIDWWGPFFSSVGVQVKVEATNGSEFILYKHATAPNNGTPILVKSISAYADFYYDDDNGSTHSVTMTRGYKSGGNDFFKYEEK